MYVAIQASFLMHSRALFFFFFFSVFFFFPQIFLSNHRKVAKDTENLEEQLDEMNARLLHLRAQNAHDDLDLKVGKKNPFSKVDINELITEDKVVTQLQLMMGKYKRKITAR